MPADYAEVLRDLDAQIESLQSEIETLKAGRPTIVMLRNKYPVKPQVVFAPAVSSGAFATLGPTAAIQELLKDAAGPMSLSEITERLKSGGLRSKGQDLSSNVGATLSRLRDHEIVERVGDGWRLKGKQLTPQEAFGAPVVFSPPAPNSLVATVLHPERTSVWPQP